MTSILQIANGIGKLTTEKMIEIGIDTVEKLANSGVEDLLIIDGIGIKGAERCIRIAKKHLENIKAREKINVIIKKGYSSKESKSEVTTFQKPTEQKTKSNISISSIKKLASSNVEDLSKIGGMAIADAKRYIEIAKNYLESMRIKEREEDMIKEKISIDSSSREPTPKSQLLGFVKFKEPKKTQLEIPLQKTEIIQKHKKGPTLIDKSIKKPTIEEITKKPKVEEKAKIPPELKTFFPEETMQRIRFLHHKIKHLEEALQRNEEFAFSELNNVIDYIKILNVNYKTQSQIKIFKELDISTSFYDPIERRSIKIWDLIFECARALWVSAQAYSFLSNKFESENQMEKAIVAMVECSKMYKTSAYFSAACARQEDTGTSLSVENLELNSEESRILAQNLATISEENNENYTMASSLSSGLSALTKRLAFLKRFDQVRENHFKAQYNYDLGRACHFKAKALQKSSPKGGNEKEIEDLQKKANYYYLKAEEVWEGMLNRPGKLKDPERDNIRTNLSIVNENIIENDVDQIDEAKALEIQDPEPLIIIPENLAPFIPRTTNYLTKYKQADLNFDAYRRYKNLMSDVLLNFNRIEELQNSKAGIGRTIKQLKILYENNDIDINSFTELFEKYSIKLEVIENAIRNLKNPKNRNDVKEIQKETYKLNI
ncbi:MAG: helix-hairpin-helix domain-containing protein [Promethearchaeota archaeon]